jgi:hypothetical protein
MAMAGSGSVWRLARIPFEQVIAIEPDPVRLPALCSGLWGCFRSSCASSSTPAGCLLHLEHGLDEAARGAKSG